MARVADMGLAREGGREQLGHVMKNHDLICSALFALVSAAGLLAGVFLALVR